MSQRIETHLNELKSLPVLEPPAALEAATLAAMASVGEGRGRAPLGLAAAWIGLAVTGGLLLAALTFDSGQRDGAGTQSVAAGAASDGSADSRESTNVADEAAYLALLEESVYLEQVLAVLPQREIMRVSTAGTIVGLEQQLALIDTVLLTAYGPEAPPEYRVTLMRDRVETMNALVNVRYAQSHAFYH